MSTDQDQQQHRPDEAEKLLPWYATNRLTPTERAEVEAALSANPALHRQLGLIEEEQAETVRVNEGLGSPVMSRRALDQLFARIDAVGGQGTLATPAQHSTPVTISFKASRRSSPLAAVVDWIADLLVSLTPRTLSLAAAAAAVVVLVQVGVIAVLVIEQSSQGGGFETASDPSAEADRAARSGAFLLIGFQPNATVEQITNLLQARDALIVDGPKPGGLYRVKISDRPLPPSDLNRIASEIRATGSVVRFAAPTGP